MSGVDGEDGDKDGGEAADHGGPHEAEAGEEDDAEVVHAALKAVETDKDLLDDAFESAKALVVTGRGCLGCHAASLADGVGSGLRRNDGGGAGMTGFLDFFGEVGYEVCVGLGLGEAIKDALCGV